MSREQSQVPISEVQEAHQTLLQAQRCLSSDDPAQAQELCEQLIECYPDYVAALCMLGTIHIQRDDYAAALPHLARAAMLNPKDGVILINLGKIYLQLGAEERAITILEQSIKLAPEKFSTLNMLGWALTLQGHYGNAANYFERACVIETDGSAHIWLSKCYIHLGRHEDAAAALKKGLDKPLSRDAKAFAYMVASTLPTNNKLDLDVLAAVDSLGSAQPEDDKYTMAGLSFVRASCLERLGQHKEAWDVLVEANAPLAKRYEASAQHYTEQMEVMVSKCRHWHPRVTDENKENDNTPLSLFILGTSRSGKTTMERFIGTLPGIEMLQEFNHVRSTARYVSQCTGLLTINNLCNLPKELDPIIAETYKARLLKSAGDADIVTVTASGAITDVGRLLDCGIKSKFIFIKRDDNDVAFRIFGQLYMQNTNVYAYDLKDIYSHISNYKILIDNWLEKLGNQAILVNYEDMVSNPAKTLKRVAKFCGLKPPLKLDQKSGDDRHCSKPYKKWLHATKAS